MAYQKLLLPEMYRNQFVLNITAVKCLRTVCVERTEQEPSTAYSGELGFRKCSVRESTHFEIIDGHLLIIFSRDFPASLAKVQQWISDIFYTLFFLVICLNYEIAEAMAW